MIYSNAELSDLKLWFANEGFLTIAAPDSQKGGVFVKTQDYTSYLNNFYQKNFNETVKDGQPLDVDEAVAYFQKQVFSYYLQKIEKVSKSS